MYAKSLTNVGIPPRPGVVNQTPLYKLTAEPPEPQASGTKDDTSGTDSENRHQNYIEQPWVEVRKSPGKGFGLFAVDRIPAYTKILEDDALLSLASNEDLPQLWEKHQLLPIELKQKFDDLSFPTTEKQKEEAIILKLQQRGYNFSVAEQMARVRSKFQANAFKNGVTLNAISNFLPASDRQKDMPWSYSLFSTIARINHRCTPNAHTHYRPQSCAQLLYALRDIEPDEEIEIAYFDLTMPLSDRQTRAQSWGFQCMCDACGSAGKLTTKGYEKELAALRRNVSATRVRKMNKSDYETIRDDIQKAIGVAMSPDYPWLKSALPNLWCNLSLILQKLQDVEDREVERALNTALEWESRITGDASPATQHLKEVLRSRALVTDKG